MAVLRTVVASLCLVALSYVFFVTLGTMRSIPDHRYSYYKPLSQSLLAGHLSLPIEPDAALLAAPNPYAPELAPHRVWDTVYYKGKFYIYWGPVPALMMSAAQWLGFDGLRDATLVLALQFLQVALMAAILVRVRRSLGDKVSLPMLAAAILCCAWVSPTPSILVRPAAYEAAIVTGQFFIVLALFLLCLTPKLGNPKGRVWLFAVVGLCLSLAGASRAALLPAVGAMVLYVAYFFSRRSGADRTPFLHGVLALGVPIGIGVIALLAYNYVRFDSPFEFGFRYINTYYLPDHIIYPRYFAANTWQYLFRLPQFSSEFPFVLAPSDPHFYLPSVIGMPAGYAGWEPMIGLAVGAPLTLLFAWTAGEARRSLPQSPELVSLVQRSCMIFGIFAAAVIMMHFASTMRYMADFATTLKLAGFIGAFAILSRQNERPKLARLVTIFIYAAGAYSSVVAFLVWADYMDIVRQFNPELMKTLKEIL